MDEDLEYFEVMTLDEEKEQFCDQDGEYQLFDGKWYEIIPTDIRAEQVIIH